MRAAMMTREYPPDVYGGAGVHVTELVRNLRLLCEVDVHCIGAPRAEALAVTPDPALADANLALQTLSAELRMVQAAAGVDIVHSQTWYSGMAGHLSALMYGVPHVLTAHSLEPRRPWKADQLGGGYRISSWSEREAMEHADAVIAVSSGMRSDVLETYPAIDPGRVHVIPNGVDTDVFRPGPRLGGPSVLDELGVDPDRPIVAFVGRITRQKGLWHLLAAAHRFAPSVQLVLCAVEPDTPQLGAQIEAAVARLHVVRSGVHWIRDMLPSEDIREILAAATVLVCPSVYEPQGIVNLEAMACGTAVVASDVGGIPEVVADGRTGILVHYNASDPEAFESGLAHAVNALVLEPDRARRLGDAGRAHAIAHFSWSRIARRTLDIYERVCAG
ncbi:glycogen synthase [Rhodococcus sp. D2-41]|uniref:glycogen synthase n=1 Tax=Speluncibacter jeojiensis TaxID=2710754 RepID=UPI0024101C3D|nr:glycogen synthase [Rhodococcus sp. D2-41]MDG3012507.1 glycogen synthase [Rhodococcus sp. D2-41]